MDVNSHSTATIVKWFRRLSTATIVAVVLLILIGGIVRMAGAGMGCPDWPRCFGQWIPPTNVSQLPDNYQEVYKDRGYASTEFNAFKTWVEYVNRLIGVLIGLIALTTAAYSLNLRKRLPKVTLLSILSVFLIAVQGGIGAYVVRTNLQTGMITLHMMVALGILMVLILARLHSYRFTWNLPQVPGSSMFVGVIVLILTLTQIILGTQVREDIDILAKTLGHEQRSEWLSLIEGAYHVHKYFYYAVVAGLSIWFYQLRKLSSFHPVFRALMSVVILTTGSEIVLGIAMHHLGIPPWIQPVHLMLATVIAGAEFSLLGVLYFSQRKRIVSPELMHTT